MPKVFDCFTFFNELELLELRLNELAPVVSRFVIAEATRTHKGDPKPLYFQEHRSRFAPFLDRITHVIVDDLPIGGASEVDHFRRENHQRNALARGLETASGNDFVIVSDLDEIPRAEIVRRILHERRIISAVHVFELRWFYYFLNYEKSQPWALNGPRMARLRHIPSPQQLRRLWPPRNRSLLSRLRWMRSRFGTTLDFVIHRDAGWHFSYMGGVDAVVTKLTSYLHIHPDAQIDPRHIAGCIAAGRSYDPHDRDSLTLRAIDDGFPAYLRENAERFQALIADEDRLGAISASHA